MSSILPTGVGTKYNVLINGCKGVVKGPKRKKALIEISFFYSTRIEAVKGR